MKIKLKISIGFLFLAIALVLIVLKKDIFKDSSAPADITESIKEVSKSEIFDYLRNTKFVSYSGLNVKIDYALIESADVINIHFWASWCGPCVNEVPELIEFAKRVSVKNEKNLKVIFIAVSLDDSKDDLNKFLKSFPEFNNEPFIKIWDKEKTFSKLVNADRLPMTIILNKNIPEPRIVRGVVEWKNIHF